MAKQQAGKLIVIEGVDGSGKQTQSQRLYGRLAAQGKRVLRVAYPRYDEDSSAMVRHYLAGDFGEDPDAVSPYVAATFFAADRYASYRQEVGPFLAGGGLVIADRYTTANMLHQAGKIADAAARQAFLDWLEDYEFRLLGLPRPDAVIYLDMPPEASAALMAGRANKMTGEAAKDIHESHPAYLERAYRAGRELVARYGWTRIDCLKDGVLQSVDAVGGAVEAALRDQGILA